jgi:hypothetical protein
MQAEQMIAKADGASVLVDDVGKALGLSSEDSRALANYMRDNGWAFLDFTPTIGQPTLRLTPRGFDEIAKLRWPRWRQWLDRHGSLFVTLVVGSLSGLLGALAYDIIKGLLWPR